MSGEPPPRRILLPSGRSVVVSSPSERPAGSWISLSVGSHHIVQRLLPDGTEEAVSGRSTLAITLDRTDADALARILNGADGLRH